MNAPLGQILPGPSLNIRVTHFLLMRIPVIAPVKVALVVGNQADRTVKLASRDQCFATWAMQIVRRELLKNGIAADAPLPRRWRERVIRQVIHPTCHFGLPTPE